jgi:hypothetical protein
VKNWLERKKLDFIIWFWWKMPNSVLYFAVNQAWAKATTTKFTNCRMDDVTFTMVQKFLSEKKVASAEAGVRT